MDRRLFEDLVVSAPAAPARSSRYAAAAIAVHAAAAAALATGPLLMPAALPDVVVGGPVIYEMPAVVPPTPAPPVRVPEAPPRSAERRAPALTAAAQPASAPAPTLPDDPVGFVPPEPGVPETPVCLTNCGSGPANAVGSGPGDAGEPGAGAPGAPRVVGRDVTPPRKLRHVPPAYPELARRARVQGQVKVECIIGLTGRVEDLRVLDGPPLLHAAAEDAVRQWIYTPTLLDGRPVPVVMTITVIFTLQ